MSNTVRLKNYLNVFEEWEAAAALTPGHLVELTSANKVQKHSTAGETAIPMFALEDELQGKEISDDYAADDPVQVWIPTRGDRVYALLANNENVAVGDFLVSNGDGTLKKYVPAEVSGESGFDSGTSLPDQKVVAQALEELNPTAGDAERIVVRIV